MDTDKIFKFLDACDWNVIPFLRDMKRMRIMGQPFTTNQLLAIERCIPQKPIAPDGHYLVGDRTYSLKTYRDNQIIKDAAGNKVSADDPDILKIRANALEHSKAFGRQTGVCGICNATLTNPESIALGIGPICAGRF